MITQTKDNKSILIRKYELSDCRKLVDYLNQLSPETKNRFGPHLFNEQSVLNFYENSTDKSGYIAINPETSDILAYSIIKTGILEHDRVRLMSYNLELSDTTDCTFAPSVSDSWQGKGVGNLLFNFIKEDLIRLKIKRIILWGGVQCNNTNAVNYYLKNNFRILGEFQYYGNNYDMIKESI